MRPLDIPDFELLITGCSDPQMWYADMVDKRVPLVAVGNDGYLSREPAGCISIVKLFDGKLIKQHKQPD